MNDPFAPIALLLTDVILPNLQTVQTSQTEQIAANDRLAEALKQLELYMKSQFGLLNAQLTACRAEIAALQASLEVAQAQKSRLPGNHATLVH
jgi:hypothetical protein